MPRVSSRQRLVSWDTFDAAAPEDSSSSSSASREAGDGDTATCKNKRTEPAGMIPRTTTHDSSEGITLPLQPPTNDFAHHNADDDFYSVAGYDSLPSTAACASNNNAGRRSSSSANDNHNAGWSFDHSDNDREAPGSSSPSGGSRRKRDRADHSIRGADSPRFSAGSSTKKNVESLSALPHFPSLLEEDSIPLDLDKKEGADGGKGGRHKGMARTPSLLDLMAVKPSASAVGAVHLPINTTEHLVPHTSTASTGQQKSLIIPRVPSKIGLGNRVASDLSLNSTLSRYMSVPSNLCAMPSGMGGGAVALEETGADLGMTMSTSSSVAGTYSPSSQSQGVANLSMDSAEAEAEAEADKFLPGDALCTVASYLATSELRELSTTNADLRVHFAGPSGKHLWVDHATRRWPAILQPEDEEKSAEVLQDDDAGGNDNYVSIRANRFDDKVVEIVDRIGVATAGLGSEDTMGLSKSQSQQQPNFSALLGLAAKDCPTAMSPCPMPSASEVPGRQRRIRSGEEFTVVRVTGDSGSCRSAVQFTSRVGEGDRSITSDAPLPRPLQPPRAVNGGEGSGENGPSSYADGTNKSSSSSSSNRWSPRLPSVPSSTQTLITFLRTASRVSGRGDDGEDGSNANGRPGRLRPFVCPYVASEDADRTVIDMTPRLVAYYEVKILPHDTIVKHSITQEDTQTAATLREGFSPSASTSNVVRNPHHHHHHRRSVSAQGPEMPPLLHLPGPALGAAVPGGAVPLRRNLPLPRHVAGGQHGIGEPGPGNGDNGGGNEESLDTECVAIGLSTSRFRPAAKMPGWDAHSFGYHSDDGGIFHGAGDMEREFGKTYGVGDTVGCGIDYSHGDGGGAIFFTLNGEFLGYAWTNVAAISLGEDMYPTVGVDSNCPLEINFGSHPFAFDLGSFVEGQRHCVEAALGPLAPSVSRSKTAAEEEEAEESDDVMGRYLDHDVGAGLLYDSSKIDEWGCLEPSSAHGTSGSSAKWNGMGGSAMRSTRTRNGGLQRPRNMFRGQYA